MKFRKKPVVIEAVHFNDSAAVEAFLGAYDPHRRVRRGTERRNCSADNPDGFDYPILYIPTLEGEMVAGPGDWIIRGVAGELYPCKPDIFAATYDVVDEKSTLETGDVVRTKAGLPMTVETVDDVGVRCAWFEGSTMHRWTFDPSRLEHTSERTPPPEVAK